MSQGRYSPTSRLPIPIAWRIAGGGEEPLHDISPSGANPAFFREGVAGDHAVPVAQKSVHGLRIRLPVQTDEGLALPLTLALRLGIGGSL